MEAGEIQEMFRAAADLRNAGPYDPGRPALEAKYADLRAKYMEECMAFAPEPPAPEPDPEPEYVPAINYLSMLLSRATQADPASAAANQALWGFVLGLIHEVYSKKKEE